MNLNERFPAKKVSSSTLQAIARRARDQHARNPGAARSLFAQSRLILALKTWMSGRNIGVLDIAALGAIAFIGLSLLSVQWRPVAKPGPKDNVQLANAHTPESGDGRGLRRSQAGDGGDEVTAPKPQPEPAPAPDTQPPAEDLANDDPDPPEPPKVNESVIQELRQATEELRNAKQNTEPPMNVFDNSLLNKDENQKKFADPAETAPRPSAGAEFTTEKPVVLRNVQTAGERRLLFKTNGGSHAISASIDLACRWLAYHQEADGHWDAVKYGAANKVDTAVTAMAVLTMLRSGEPAQTYRANLLRAIAWLMSKQQQSGLIFDTTDAGAHRGIGYPGGIATLALCEAAARDPMPTPELLVAAQRAVNYAMDHQQGEGNRRLGWRYTPKSNGDISVSGWWIAALKSAKIAGLTVPHECFEGAIAFLDSLENKNSGASTYAYMVGKDANKRRTFIGNYCRQMLGWRIEDLQKSIEGNILQGGLPAWGANGESVDLYYWYYGTQCALNQGGDCWNQWRGPLANALVENQCRVGDDAGSWPIVGDFSGEWGRAGQTALAGLCLDVFYQRRAGPVIRNGGAGQLQSVAPPAPVDAREEIVKKMKLRVSFEFVDKPLPKVVEFLNDLAGVKFELTPEAAKMDAPVTLRVSEMELELALKWICKLADLDYQIKNGKVMIGNFPKPAPDDPKKPVQPAQPAQSAPAKDEF